MCPITTTMPHIPDLRLAACAVNATIPKPCLQNKRRASDSTPSLHNSPGECAKHLLCHAREANYVHEEDGDIDMTPRQRSHLRNQAHRGRGAGRIEMWARAPAVVSAACPANTLCPAVVSAACPAIPLCPVISLCPTIPCVLSSLCALPFLLYPAMSLPPPIVPMYEHMCPSYLAGHQLSFVH